MGTERIKRSVHSRQDSRQERARPGPGLQCVGKNEKMQPRQAPVTVSPSFLHPVLLPSPGHKPPRIHGQENNNRLQFPKEIQFLASLRHVTRLGGGFWKSPSCSGTYGEGRAGAGSGTLVSYHPRGGQPGGKSHTPDTKPAFMPRPGRKQSTFITESTAHHLQTAALCLR